MPCAITATAMAPNERNRTVWNVLTHAVRACRRKTHHDQRHDGAAEPEAHQSIAHRPERRPAAHHGDHDVGDEQHGLDGEDDGPDVAAFPPIAEHLHRRHEAVALAERPEARADREQAERNNQRGRGRHQAVGDDAVGEGVARRAEDRERRHVGAEQRQHEHTGPACGRRGNSPRRLRPDPAPARSKDVPRRARYPDDGQICKDYQRRNHSPPDSSR
jgi:hypothetical protein